MNVFQESLSVHVDGYAVRTVGDVIFGNEDARDTRCLVANSTRFVRRRAPPASQLLSNFLATERTEDGFLAFASRYGMLLSPSRQSVTLDLTPAEALLDWHIAWTSLNQVQRAVRVAQADVGERNPAENRVRVTGDRIMYVDREAGSRQAWSKSDSRFRLIDGLRSGERARQVAFWFAQDAINKWLETETSMQLMFTAKGVNEPPRIVMQPLSLAGVMWSMLARVVDQGRRIAVCEHCGTIMEPKRATRKWCSDACRKAGQRQRRSVET